MLSLLSVCISAQPVNPHHPNTFLSIILCIFKGCYIHALLNLFFFFVASNFCLIKPRRTICQFPGHQGAVRGLTASTDGRILVSCGTDCT